MKKKLTEDMIEDLKKDYGVLSTKEITQKYNCSYSTIERFCKSNNFKSKREPTVETKAKYNYLADNIDEFLIDWENNIIPTKELIKKYQAPLSALKSKAGLYGVKRKNKVDIINTKELIKDYQKGILSQKAICDKYNISLSTKNKILKNNNIALDPPGKRNRKYIFDEHFLDIIDTEEKAYFLGFVYADGGHNEKRHTLTITLQKRDEELLKRFYNMLKCDREIFYIYNKKYDKFYSSFMLQNSYFSKKLLELGVQQNKSFKIRFPFFLEKELVRHFIRGYFDGDGCISNSTRSWKNTSINIAGNEFFLQEIKEIIFQETGKDIKIYKTNKSKIFQLESGGIFNVYSILNYLYKDSTIYLKRKYDRYIDFVAKYEEEQEVNERNSKN